MLVLGAVLGALLLVPAAAEPPVAPPPAAAAVDVEEPDCIRAPQCAGGAAMGLFSALGLLLLPSARAPRRRALVGRVTLRSPSWPPAVPVDPLFHPPQRRA